jgi:hypothetical protein
VAKDIQWLGYRSAREARQIVGDMALQELALNSDKPVGVELPEFKGHSPLFAKWISPMVKKGFLWIGLDRSRKYGPYDQLIIDSDGDGHLNDEAMVTAYLIEQNNSRFGPVKVVFEGDDGPVTYHLNFQFYARNDEKRLSVSSGGWYEGAVTVGSVKKHCMLIDQNANGTFDDRSLNPRESDRIRISEQGDRDTRFVGDYIQVGEVLYSLEVARDGAFIKLAEAKDVTYGSVRLPETITEFSAGGENGLFSITPEKGLGRLPLGKYRIHSWTIDRKDKKDNKWRLEGSWFNDEGDFEVDEIAETDVNVGEPVISTLDVREKGSEYSFGQRLKGRLGEYISLSRNGNRPGAPKLHIKSADSKYDRTFSFEYG